MAKGKARASQRRGRSNDDAAAEDDDQHTITDSFTMASLSAYDDFTDFEDEDYDTDELIQHGGDGQEDAAMRASSRYQQLYDLLVALETDFVREKRTAHREAMLRRLYKYLVLYATGHAGYELVSHALSDIVHACCQTTLRVGSNAAATEQYAACRVIQAVTIVLGADEDAWVDAVAPTLQRMVQSSTRATAVRCAALRAWSLAVVTVSDVDRVGVVLDQCQAWGLEPVYRTLVTPVALRVAALDCWALLATLLNNDELAGVQGRGCAILAALARCLDATTDGASTESVELRSAAGECLALIHEARVNLGVIEEGDATVVPRDETLRIYPDETDDDTIVVVQSSHATTAVTSTTARRYGKGSWDASPYEGLVEDIKQTMSELATESGHYLSKRVKKAQRATFREYLATLVDDESPEEVVHFRHHGTLTLSTWREVIGLNFVRHALQGGFQTQMITNPTLQRLFGNTLFQGGATGGSSAVGLSSVEKRLLYSKASDAYKSADQDRRGKRDKRENIKNHFLTADEDI